MINLSIEDLTIILRVLFVNLTPDFSRLVLSLNLELSLGVEQVVARPEQSRWIEVHSTAGLWQ
jgi:hypothetical protein